MLWYVDIMKEKDNGLNADLVKVDLEKGQVKIDGYLKSNGDISLDELAKILLDFCEVEKPNQIVFDEVGNGLFFKERFKEICHQSNKVNLYDNGKLDHQH